MQTDGREKLAEDPLMSGQALALSGPRPTLDRIRIEAEQEKTRRRRLGVIRKAAWVVAAVSIAAIAFALLR
jgi:predicted anti-sigma-YlaC factor YlaD